MTRVVVDTASKRAEDLITHLQATAEGLRHKSEPDGPQMQVVRATLLAAEAQLVAAQLVADRLDLLRGAVEGLDNTMEQEFLTRPR